MLFSQNFYIFVLSKQKGRYMTHKEFEKFVDGLSDLDKFHLMKIMTDKNMLSKRRKIWDANYKKLSKTKEWKDNMKERDKLLKRGKNLTKEQKARLKELDEWIDDVMVPEYFDLLVKTFNETISKK